MNKKLNKREIETKINFTDLSIFLKCSIIGGFLVFLLMMLSIISFTLGLIIGLLTI